MEALVLYVNLFVLLVFCHVEKFINNCIWLPDYDYIEFGKSLISFIIALCFNLSCIFFYVLELVIFTVFKYQNKLRLWNVGDSQVRTCVHLHYSE